METQNANARFDQVLTWYLVQAGKGGHRDGGQPADETYLKKQWAMSDQHLARDFRARPFRDVETQDMQGVIDAVAAAGSEKAASWIKGIFADVDRFAVRQGVISGVRTKRLISPSGNEEPRRLSPADFRATWETILYCGQGGAMTDRGPCLAVLVSAVTLQPLGDVISMRREEVDASRKLWVRPDPDRYVHLSDLAFSLIEQAIALADFIHRDVSTSFVFPSAGPKRDPRRPISYSAIFDVVERHIGKEATPHDLRETGLAELRRLGGDELRALVKGISRGSEALPAAAQMALVEGWAERVRSLTEREFG